MNMQKTDFYSFKHLAISGLTALLVACGGGSSDDDPVAGSSPVVARGVITQLGSIYVNGVKYETPSGGSYSDDDSTSGVANYKVGQVVSLRGRRNDDGVTGTADEVEYEAEIEGPASGGQIYGVNIMITDKTNTDDIPGNSLVDNQRYEVSGVWIDDNTLDATYIDDDDDTEDEIKGYVESLGASSFVVHGITFNGYTGTPSLSGGELVEVHFNGPCTAPPSVSCTLTSVEIEDDYFDNAEGLEVEIEGAVDLNTSGCPMQADLKVDGVCVDSGSAIFMDGLKDFADLVEGSRVEAEGHMVSDPTADYLRADKIKGRGNRVRISSFVSAKSGSATAGAFQLINGNIDVTVSSATDYDNTSFADIDASANTRVEVRGVRTGEKSMLALRVKVEDPSDSNTDEHELRAEVDLGGADETAETIKVMLITSSTDGSTQLELDDDVTFIGTVSQFLDMIDDNDNPADGPRDIVEVRIDTTSGFYAEQIELEEQDD